MFSTSTSQKAHEAAKAAILLIAPLLLALSGCGGIVLVVGGAVAGVVVAGQEGSSHDDGGPPACAAEVNAVYDGLGPDGASVLSIEIQIDSANPDSARVWIGTADSGVFHTLIDIQSPTDPITWIESGPEMRDLSVRSLSASPLDNDILLAGTDQGLYRSLDGG
ncbi:MAG: hypothetical protein O7H41_12535, partial [Planctomycetota bacterium]|nr:hypothetical protein [Planctomycetota bacterium]